MVTTVTNGDVRLEVECIGDPGRPALLFLHGFPEHRGAWRRVALALADRHYCVLPSLRGYANSSKPVAADAYRLDCLLTDVDALVDSIGQGRVTLAGHDWGGGLAWWYAARRPERLKRLVVANAPHPQLLQRRIFDDPAQRAASQYIARLRLPTAAQALLEGGAAALWQRLFANNPAFDAADRREYIAAWEQPGAMDAMLNWYRAAPFEIPGAAELRAAPAWAFAGDMVVRVPTLILWGMQDGVFCPSLLNDLAAVAPDHRLCRFEQNGHGIIHEIPALLAHEIDQFCRA